ncbi:MAG TPA: hypothetical protein VK463_20385 [Desulfomonilaceae bacterium]|nr:hypothetical protein [Desulfomonilaceae bacterium]
MTEITAVYIGLVIAGLLWLAWKIRVHAARERDRESRLNEQLFGDDNFKIYLEKLKKQNGVAETRDNTPTKGQHEESK